MEEQSKIIIRITDEGIIIGDYLVMGYDELIHLIVQKECKIIFDSEDAFQNLKNGIEPYIEEIYCIQQGYRDRKIYRRAICPASIN